MAPTSLSLTYKVIPKLYMLWMCRWISLSCITARLVSQAYGSCLEFWVPPEGLTTAYYYCWGLRPIQDGSLFIVKTYKVCHHLHMLWMCKWMSPICITANSLVGQAFGNTYLELWVPPLPRGNNKEDSVILMVEARYPSKMAPTSRWLPHQC